MQRHDLIRELRRVTGISCRLPIHRQLDPFDAVRGRHHLRFHAKVPIFYLKDRGRLHRDVWPDREPREGWYF